MQICLQCHYRTRPLEVFSRSESLLPSKPGESLESTVSALELGGTEHVVLFILFTNLEFIYFRFPLLLLFSLIFSYLATLAYGLEKVCYEKRNVSK
jgi:hypothetical protein